jgi:hypothetical protein
MFQNQIGVLHRSQGYNTGSNPVGSAMQSTGYLY